MTKDIRALTFATVLAGPSEAQPRGSPQHGRTPTFADPAIGHAGLCAEAGVDVAWTAAQIGHVDPRLTLSVYTDVSNRRGSPAEKVGSLIQGDSIVPSDHSTQDGRKPLRLPPPSDLALQRLESRSRGG
jgi:hypothetical protein